MRRSIPGRILAVLALIAILGLPSVAFAQSHQALPRRAPAERIGEAGLFPRLWNALIHLWSQEGSGLDPDGRKPAGTPVGVGSAPRP